MEAPDAGPAPAEAAPAPVPAESGPRNPLQLIWAALWFQDAAYGAVRDGPKPLQRGLILVLIVTVIAGVAGAIGLGFDRLTSPDLKAVQQIVLEGMQQMSWYRQLATGPGGSAFERQFLESYNLWWQIAPGLFGAPSLGGAGALLCLTPIAGIVGWLFSGSLTHLAARWLGGKGSYGQTLGVLSLAASPQILNVLTILPSLEVAALTGWWSLALGYWAVRSVHGLSWQRNLLAVLVPRLVVTLLIVVALLVGVAAIAASAGGGS